MWPPSAAEPVRAEIQKEDPTPRGFEPLRTKSTHLAGERLNHSAKASDAQASGVGWTRRAQKRARVT